MIHQPVLLKEILEIFAPKANENFIDATLGEGGASIEILKRTAPQGKILALEFDPEILKEAQRNFKKFNLEKRVILVNENFSQIKEVVEKHKFFDFEGILFDLGISRWHFEKSKRGFSFKKNEILDLRINPKVQKLKAFEFLNLAPISKIEMVLKEFGELKKAKIIAKEIGIQRKSQPIITTFDLIKILEKFSNFLKRKHQKIHFATRVLMALRIEVNQEIRNLKIALKKAFEILKPGKKLVVISFHSLEDRIVKNFFKKLQKEGRAKILTKKPIRPSFKEIKINPASRSAKLRSLQKI